MRIAGTITLLGVAALSACSDPGMLTEPTRSPGAANLDRSDNTAGQVYTTSNATTGNAVLAFNRAADGSLQAAGSYPTGGSGTGAALGSQGALALDGSGRTLVTVNAGSNELTSFRVRENGSLERLGTVPSGGTRPISVTISHGLVYALNSGGTGNISGFRLDEHGRLHPLAGSTRPLSAANVDPAQVSFDPTGRWLVVTEKATGKLDTYAVAQSGLASGPTFTQGSGVTPFGFGFSPTNGALIVSEAFGGAPDASAVSSYRNGGNGTWSVVTGSAATTETSACWIVVTNNGRFTYTTNAVSGTITGYSIHDRALTRLDANGVTGNVGAGSGLREMALSRESRFLYTVAGGQNRIVAFVVGHDGSLTASSGGVSGLPAGFDGLVAR